MHLCVVTLTYSVLIQLLTLSTLCAFTQTSSASVCILPLIGVLFSGHFMWCICKLLLQTTTTITPQHPLYGGLLGAGHILKNVLFQLQLPYLHVVLSLSVAYIYCPGYWIILFSIRFLVRAIESITECPHKDKSRSVGCKRFTRRQLDF